MNNKWYSFILILLIISLAGCGGSGGGAPGSSGSGDTGIIITSAIVTSDSPDIDVNTICADGTSTETLTRADASIEITAALVNPNTAFDPTPATVDTCTITYYKAVEDPAAPTIRSLTVFPNSVILASGGTVDTTLIDIQRKIDFWTDINNGLNLPAEYPTHYVARYYCKYINAFGRSGTFQTEFDMWLADFDGC